MDYQGHSMNDKCMWLWADWLDWNDWIMGRVRQTWNVRTRRHLPAFTKHAPRYLWEEFHWRKFCECDKEQDKFVCMTKTQRTLRCKGCTNCITASRKN